MKRVMLILMVVVCLAGCAVAGTVTKKVWLDINTGFESIEQFRKESKWNVGEVVEVEVTFNLETKQFTYEEFYGLLGFGKLPADANEITVVLGRENCGRCTSSPYLGCHIHDKPPYTVEMQFAKEPTKPYLHKNPDNDHWICSKHGDLTGSTFTVSFYATAVTIREMTYCAECYWEVQTELINQHITGVKE